MRRVGWIIIGRGDSGEAWHPFLNTAAKTKRAAVRKWCPEEMEPHERRRAWRGLKKTGRAKLVRIYIDEVGT